MTAQGIARRYATALFDVARKSGRLDVVGRDLAAFQALVTAHAELGRVFDTPTVPARNKHALVAALTATSPDMSGEVKRLLLMLADQDRLMLLDDVAKAFIEQVMRADRVLSAEIVTAIPLAGGRAAALADALGKATGHRIVMTERVDPAIVGGLIATVGSVVYDGSVTRQIERMRGKLLAQG